MIVMKFGGTSVGSPERIAQTARIVKQKFEEQSQHQSPGVIVVTSAMSGVTNSLIETAKAAARAERGTYREARDQLLVKHLAVASQLVENDEERAALGSVIKKKLETFERLCESIAVLGELTDRGLDVVSGLGEKLNAPILAAVLRAQKLDAQAIDASELIITDASFGRALPITELTEKKCKEQLLPVLERGIVPVISGFVGATEEGIPTTLGRGGSDYSAAIIGAALQVDEIQIWTDVDGVMTADPRLVANARSLPEIGYKEIAELAYFGAKVLHPKTIMPAMQKKISLRVLNTFNPTHAGTRIVQAAEQHQNTVKAITVIQTMNLITIEGRGMIGVPGIAARAFGSVARVDANVLMISQSSSEQSICFVVPESVSSSVVATLCEEFERELHHDYIEQISGHPNIVIVAVVGSGMKGTPGIAAKIFTALADANVNVIAIAQGSSETNVSFVVAEEDAGQAVRAIHDAFELHWVAKQS